MQGKSGSEAPGRKRKKEEGRQAGRQAGADLGGPASKRQASSPLATRGVQACEPHRAAGRGVLEGSHWLPEIFCHAGPGTCLSVFFFLFDFPLVFCHLLLPFLQTPRRPRSSV